MDSPRFQGDRTMRFGAILALAAAFLFAGVASAADKDKAKDEDSYIKIEIKGKVKTGIIAVGGETTGAMITAKDGGLELEATGDLLKALEKLDGKDAVVTGTLTMKKGVEIPGMRLIVKVATVKAADAKEK
jgi:hypothetical protein